MMAYPFSIRSTLLLLVHVLFTSIIEPSNAQGVVLRGTVNVCGRTYQDAEDNCGVNPSCANLQCPNNYWEPGGVLMSCFAVPVEKCNFGGPPSEEVAYAKPLELDPNNTNYCGPIDGGWQHAVDNCSTSTACPGGTPEECGDGWTCYSGVVCDTLNPSNFDEIVLPTSSVETISTSSPASSTAGVIEEQEIIEDDISSNLSMESFDVVSSNAPEIIVLTDDTAGIIVPVGEGNSISYCGPAGARGWTRAVATCSRSTACGAGGSCPEGMVCYGGILCKNDTNEDEGTGIITFISVTEGTAPSTIASTSTTTTTTTSPTQEESVSVPPSTVSVLREHSYCGPDPAVDHYAWTTALEQCSPETSCSSNRPCPDGQTCFGGIECSAKNTKDETTSTEEATLEEQIIPDDIESTITASAQEVDDSMSPTATPTTSTSPISSPTFNPTIKGQAVTIQHINDSSATSDDTNTDTRPPQNSEQTPHHEIMHNANSFCGPDPRQDTDAFITALRNCSPQTICGKGVRCPQGQFCYSNINCSMKDQILDFYASESQEEDNNNEQSFPSQAATESVEAITEPEENRYCGPDPKEGNAWMTALRNCSPQTACGDGVPCPNGQFCYPDIDCSTKETYAEVNADGMAAADDPLLEDEESISDATYLSPTSTTIATTSSTTTTPTKIVKDEVQDINFYCGPEHDGWFKAAELCIPCPGGDGCGVGMRCYAGVSCTKLKSPADQMVLEVEGVKDQAQPSSSYLDDSSEGGRSGNNIITVRESFCGVTFEETQSECTSRPPCKASTDCGHEHLGCFPNISCTFDKDSTEYHDFISRQMGLDPSAADENNNDSESNPPRSNLRPPEITFSSRQRSGAMGSNLLNGKVAVIFPMFIALLNFM